MAKRLILKELSRYRIDTYADIINRNALLHGDKEAFIIGQEVESLPKNSSTKILKRELRKKYR